MKRWLAALLLWFSLTGFASAQAQNLSFFPDFSGQDLSGFTAVSSERQTYETTNPSETLVVRTGVAQPENRESVKILLNWSNGKETTIQVFPCSMQHDLKGDLSASFPLSGKDKQGQTGNKKGDRVDLPDAAWTVKISGGGPLFWWARPNPRRYHSSSTPVPDYSTILNNWNTIPGASDRPLSVNFKPISGGVQLFLDGSYVRDILAPELSEAELAQAKGSQAKADGAACSSSEDLFVPATLKSCAWTFASGSSYKKGVDFRTVWRSQPQFWPVDLTANARVKSFVHATNSSAGNLSAGFQAISGVPALLCRPNQAADLGLCRQGQGSWALEVDEYLMRQPADAFPTAVCFRVPAQPYYRVWFAFAFDPETVETAQRESQQEALRDTQQEAGKAAAVAPAQKSTISPPPAFPLTARLTKYVDPGVGVNRIADTTVLFDESRLKSCRQIGSVVNNGKTIPVYWTSLDLDVGKITDLVANRSWRENPCSDAIPEQDARGGRFLDFEFIGPKVQTIHQTDERCKPDSKVPCPIQILGATLESAPAILDFIEAQPGNVFSQDEKAKLTVAVIPVRSGKGSVQWTITDFDGKQTQQQLRAVDFTNFQPADCPDNLAVRPISGANSAPISKPLRGTITFDVNLRQPVGFYWLDVAYLNESGQPLYNSRVSFSILPKDERRAGLESPYTTWWFCGAHFVADAPSVVGPVLKKAGFRSVNFCRYDESDLLPFGVAVRQATLSPASNLRFLTGYNPELSDFGVADIAKAELTNEGKEAIDKQMTLLLEKYPNLKEVCVFHESCPGAIPYELFGHKQIWKDNVDKKYRLYAAMTNATGKYMRAKYPRIKLIVGNTGPSIAAANSVLQFGADSYYIDALGSEATCQQYQPEKLCDGNVQSASLVEGVAKAFAANPIPVSGCYEFSSRTNRMLGYKKQAQWYVRDMLLCLARQYSTISVSSIIEPGNCYHNTLWGNGGMMHRSPYMNPKPAYHAMAVLTNVFDQVRFVRQIETGSDSVFAVEFNRYSRKPGEGQRAVAFWNPRGEAVLTVQFATSPRVCVIDMMGTEQIFNDRELRLETGESPKYVIADAPIQKIEIIERRFADDSARAEKSKVCCSLNSADCLAVSSDKSLDTRFEGNEIYFPARKRSDCTLKTVSDPQKGNCVEVQFSSENPENWTRYVTEYAKIELTDAALSKPFDSQSAGLGVWVRGNSNGGRILFEIEDGDGEIWRSTGEGGWGCDAFDWPGFAAVNFDGWNFVSVPLKTSDLFDAYGPGAAKSQWAKAGTVPGRSAATPPDGKLGGDMKLRAIYVEQYREHLGLFDFRPTKEPIRLKDFSAF